MWIGQVIALGLLVMCLVVVHRMMKEMYAYRETCMARGAGTARRARTKLPVRFAWNDPEIEGLREKAICRSGEILWRGQGEYAEIMLPIGRHELEFVWISESHNLAKQRVIFIIWPDGRTQTIPIGWEFYPRKQASHI